MKLLYITNQICGAAGLERVLSIKAKMLAEDFNYDVHIITLNQDDTPLFYDFGNAITYHDISLPNGKIGYVKTYMSEMKSLVKTINPDIISVCDDGLKGFFLPLILGKPCKMIYERHVSKEIEKENDTFNLFKWLKQKLTYNLMYFGGSFYDKFVVLTKGNLNEWPLKNTVVINNPLSFADNVPTSNLSSKIVLAVGRQDYQKGYERLLESWVNVQKVHPDWHLHIYGKKKPELQLSELTKTLKIEKSVSFFDPVKNISNVYKNSSIFTLSSRYEGFGMVLTEAMVHGVPCVSFDCPYGPSDIVDHSENGFLIPNGDVKGFSDAIIQLISNTTLRYDMGKAAKEKAMVFKPEKILNTWDTLFRSLN